MRTSFRALWTNTISTISGIFQTLCWRNAAHSCYVGLGVLGRLLRSALVRHWGRWEFRGRGCRERQPLFFSFSGLLQAPADSSICSELLGRMGKNWPVLRAELPTGAIQGQADVCSCCLQADAGFHIPVLTKGKKITCWTCSNMSHRQHMIHCYYFILPVVFNRSQGSHFSDWLFAKFSFPDKIQLNNLLPLCRCETRNLNFDRSYGNLC